MTEPSEFLYLSYEDTTRLALDFNEVIGVFEDAFRRVGAGEGVYHSRVRLTYPPHSDQGAGRRWQQNMRILPAILPGVGAGLRIGATKGRTASAGGGGGGGGGGGSLLVLFDFETMKPKAIISDYLIHGIRSGAPDGVAAKSLARKSARTLGVLGSGRIARSATRAISAVRPIQRIKVYSPNPDHRTAYAQEIGRSLGIDVEDHDHPEPVVRDSEIVVAAATASTAVLKGEWLSPGCTIISNAPEELDAATLRRARIVSAIAEEMRLHVPPYQAVVDLLASGELSEEALETEMADVLLGRAPGRISEDEIIAFLNSGCGIYDVAMAAYVYERARQQGLGTWLSA